MAYSNPEIVGGGIGDAAHWIEHLLFGSLGMAIAVLAVGLMGFRMLLGYSSPREVGRILLGCFILFGAPTIARALTGETEYHDAQMPSELRDAPIAAMPRPSSSIPQMPPTTTNPFDPYVGGTSAH